MSEISNLTADLHSCKYHVKWTPLFYLVIESELPRVRVKHFHLRSIRGVSHAATKAVTEQGKQNAHLNNFLRFPDLLVWFNGFVQNVINRGIFLAFMGTVELEISM